MGSWRTALALSNVVIIGDIDEPGRVLGQRRAEFFSARLVFPPEEYQDIDKFYLADPEAVGKLLKYWSRE